MSKSIKTFCIALSAGIALSININTQGAKADVIDDAVNECIEVSQSRSMTFEEVQYCNSQIELKRERDYQIQNLNIQNEIFQQGIQNQIDIMEQLANPVEIEPTDFGIQSN
jgi:hypothetical protein